MQRRKKITKPRKKLAPKRTTIWKFPGTDIQKKIKTGKPLLRGRYLCFCRSNGPMDGMPMTEINILNWNGKKWGHGKQVLGHIGPLPNMTDDELMEYTPDESPLTFFFIGTKEQASLFEFDDGPFYSIIEAASESGENGKYIFMVNSRRTKAFPCRKWNKKEARWKMLPAEKKWFKKLTGGNHGN